MHLAMFLFSMIQSRLLLTGMVRKDVFFRFSCSKKKSPVLVCQDVCGAADTRQQPADVSGPGRLRLLQTVSTHHHGSQGSQIYPFPLHYTGYIYIE